MLQESKKNYAAYKALLERARCPSCLGTGQRDSGVLGDSSPRTWMCTACDGTGLKRGVSITVDIP